ncbi:hypothetical protein MPLA_1670006 [Mesorhizobium sp. ORS 3359]|nr:hypothetical protein MPLA_1670006 [Mesorhizobium sp. ORS 3359]
MHLALPFRQMAGLQDTDECLSSAISANHNLGWIGEEHAIGLVLRRLQHAWTGARRNAA